MAVRAKSPTLRPATASAPSELLTTDTKRIDALCGHGHFDLAAYDDYLSGRMTDEDVTEDRLAAALATLPKVG